jgi:hypothetical protein
MPSRFAKLLCLLAAVQLLGGHWAALQSVAWFGMVVSFASQEESIAGALEKTFDGDHPCGLCKAVQQGHQEEQKQDSAKVTVKFDAVLAMGFKLPLPREEVRRFFPAAEQAAVRTLSPPVPPPLA